ncbi:phosphotransferase family protein [Halalkalicoccus ordinarius]|uniref:phosphotransferase family protein n=1 Tax=Halalkalicoccus ordinarius TaxID=3116651 RepID=UPI00300E9D89
MTDVSEEYFRRLVDEEALRSYLEEELGPTDEFSIQRHAEGHSNETLFLTWGERELVLRRPPPGETADTAHDVLREYRVMDALQNTEVPMPTTVLACEDHDVLGSDFYLMERVEGTVLRDEEPERFAEPAHRERIGEELVDTLAAIHGVDHEAVGLDGFGRPAGFTERQVERWGRQLEWASEVTNEVREVPELDRVGEWLEANVPEEYPHTLVHGDYKLDNVSFAPGAAPDRGDDGPTNRSPPELVAVFDWEMSALGDPLVDLGWTLSYWRDPKDPEPAMSELTARFMEREGYPTRRELVDRYERETGMTFENDRFYRALAVYKLAGLGEMFLRRYLEGNADDPLYPLMEERVPALAERAVRILDGKEPL